MNYRHYITIGSSRTEVFPLNFLSTSLVDEPETDQIFYRRKFEGSLTFVNTNGAADFDLLYLNETTDPCGEIIYEIELNGVNYFTGYFSTTDGDFNLDRCTFEVNIKTNDKYTDILDKQETEVNILNYTLISSMPFVSLNIQDLTTIFTHNKFLIDVIKYLASQLVGGATVSSTFLTAAINPVSLGANHLLYLTIAQKSDFIRPTATDPATVANLSWKSLMDILWGMFQVKWDYDLATNEFNVEHISFWTKTNGLDLRTQILCKASNKYSYVKEEMPKWEKFYFAEALDINFIGAPIRYESKCVNQDAGTNVKETKINVTTDIEYIMSDPDEIKDDGFVICCNYLSGGSYYIEYGVGSMDSAVVLNVHLSWANLHNFYFRHNRVLNEGYINGILTTFWTAQKNKLQPVNAIVCPSDNFDPNDLITTELGETYLDSVKASVKKSTLKPTGEMALELVYGPADNENTGITENGYILIEQEATGVGFDCITVNAILSMAMDIDRDMQVTLKMYDGVGTLFCESDPETWTITAGSITSTYTIATPCAVGIPEGYKVELTLESISIEPWTWKYTVCDKCLFYI